MSKKPLLSEGTARKWAKYAGIQNESKTLLSEMYKEELEEQEEQEEEVQAEGSDEEDDILQELEDMLAEQDDSPEPEEEVELEEPEEEAELEEPEEEAELEDEAAMMSQENVEAALKAGLEAMASAVADALKIKIDVRSGDDSGEMDMDPEMEMDPEMDMEMDMDPEMEMEPEEEVMEMADPMDEELYEGINRDKLVEKVMKRVAARLVKKSKKK